MWLRQGGERGGRGGGGRLGGRGAPPASQGPQACCALCPAVHSGGMCAVRCGRSSAQWRLRRSARVKGWLSVCGPHWAGATRRVGPCRADRSRRFLRYAGMHVEGGGIATAARLFAEPGSGRAGDALRDPAQGHGHILSLSYKHGGYFLSPLRRRRWSVCRVPGKFAGWMQSRVEGVKQGCGGGPWEEVW